MPHRWWKRILRLPGLKARAEGGLARPFRAGGGLSLLLTALLLAGGLAFLFLSAAQAQSTERPLSPAAPTVVEFPVVTNPYAQTEPAISGDVVVWTDGRNGNNCGFYLGACDIYAKNLAAGVEFPMTTNPAHQAQPAIDGNIVVWQDFRNSPGNWSNPDIYDWNGAEFAVITATGVQQKPAISGNIVVWEDDSIYPAIFAKNLSTGAVFLLGNLNSLLRTDPAISGNIVVWYEYRNLNNAKDIYGENLTTRSEIAVTTNPATQRFPAISGNIVVWEDFRNSPSNDETRADIYGRDLSSPAEFAVVTNTAHQGKPAISGHIVVWEDYRNGSNNADIYGKNLATGEEFRITTNSANQLAPSISGNIVVWTDYRNGNADIYGARLSWPLTPTPTPTPCSRAISGTITLCTGSIGPATGQTPVAPYSVWLRGATGSW